MFLFANGLDSKQPLHGQKALVLMKARVHDFYRLPFQLQTSPSTLSHAEVIILKSSFVCGETKQVGNSTVGPSPVYSV